MPKFVAGVTQINQPPVFYCNGYKFKTAEQANNYQREQERLAKMRAIVAEVCQTRSSKPYVVNVSNVIAALRCPKKRAALLEIAKIDEYEGIESVETIGVDT